MYSNFMKIIKRFLSGNSKYSSYYIFFILYCIIGSIFERLVTPYPPGATRSSTYKNAILDFIDNNFSIETIYILENILFFGTFILFYLISIGSWKCAKLKELETWNKDKITWSFIKATFWLRIFSIALFLISSYAILNRFIEF